ncbi:MAG: hypothetical protein OXC19_00840 [Bryobacterales bacterium]|nr:hypothetical protein [Bryobacterales bacterium]
MASASLHLSLGIPAFLLTEAQLLPEQHDKQHGGQPRLDALVIMLGQLA